MSAAPADSLAFTVETRASVADWVEARRSSVGSSEAGAIWGESSFSSLRSVYESKVNGIEPDIDPEWAAMGHLLEPVIATLYHRRSGYELIDPGAATVYRSVKWPWMSASLDRVIDPGARTIVGGMDAGGKLVPAGVAVKGPGVLEAKSRQAWAIKEWDDALPLDTVLQVQHQLAVTGWSWGVIGVLFGNQPRFIELERDDELIEMHVDKCRLFWEAVQAKAPPPTDAHPATLDAIKRRYSVDPGKAVQLDADALDAWKRLSAVKDVIKKAEEAKRGLEAQLRDTLKDAEVGVLPDGEGMLRISTVKEAIVPATTRRGYTKLMWKKL